MNLYTSRADSMTERPRSTPAGISGQLRAADPDFRYLSDHPYGCLCDKCYEWWRYIGRESAQNENAGVDQASL